MTEIFWQQDEINKEFSSCSSLGEILDLITQQREQFEELVCDIQVNGKFLSEERERELSGLSRDELTSLRITSQTKTELLLNSLRSQGELVVSMRAQVVKAYTSFRSQGIDRAHQEFCEVLEGCQFLAEALGLLKAHLSSNRDIDLTETDWRIAESKFEASVLEMLKAYEAKDYQVAADVLEYELDESLELWKQTLNYCLLILE